MRRERRRQLFLAILGGLLLVALLVVWLAPWLAVSYAFLRVQQPGSRTPAHYGFRIVYWTGERGRDATLAAFRNADPPIEDPRKLGVIVEVLKEARDDHRQDVAGTPLLTTTRWVDVPPDPDAVDAIVEAISRVPPTPENRELRTAMFLGLHDLDYRFRFALYVALRERVGTFADAAERPPQFVPSGAIPAEEAERIRALWCETVAPVERRRITEPDTTADACYDGIWTLSRADSIELLGKAKCSSDDLARIAKPLLDADREVRAAERRARTALGRVHPIEIIALAEAEGEDCLVSRVRSSVPTAAVRLSPPDFAKFAAVIFDDEPSCSLARTLRHNLKEDAMATLREHPDFARWHSRLWRECAVDLSGDSADPVGAWYEDFDSSTHLTPPHAPL